MNKRFELADLSDLEAPSVVMMIGVPGSGKSYIGKQLGEVLGLPVISSDKCREELSGDANDQSVSSEAWALVYARAGQEIDEGRSVIIDGTHANLEVRRRDILRYKEFGAKAVVGVLIATDIDVCLHRNNSRERVVPEFVIRNMQSSLDSNPPSTDDGFDYVVPISN